MEKPLNNRKTFLQSKEPNNEIIANWQETARRVVISKLTNKEIRNYEEADLKKLDAGLQRLSIWLTNNSIEEEFALPKTMETLKFSWPDFSLEEIEHAVDMALANKFDEKIELKANYLSPMYLFGCMRLYRAYRGKIMTEYWDAVQAYHDKNYVPDPSESKLGVAISVVTCYAKYLSNPIKEHHEYKSVIYSIIYSNLKNNGFFSVGEKPASTHKAMLIWFEDLKTELNAENEADFLIELLVGKLELDTSKIAELTDVFNQNFKK